MKIKQMLLLENVGFDMTPMIDCVFQLIIFFMLATDFTQNDLARVWLPLASAAVEDNHPDKDRLVINISHEPPQDQVCAELDYDSNGELLRACLDDTHWAIMIKGRSFTLEQLEKEIRLEGDKDRPAPTPKNPDPCSNRPVMIRSDAGAPYRVIQKVMEACGRAKVWKLEIGAAKPAENQ